MKIDLLLEDYMYCVLIAPGLTYAPIWHKLHKHDSDSKPKDWH